MNVLLEMVIFQGDVLRSGSKLQCCGHRYTGVVIFVDGESDGGTCEL